MIVVFVLDEWLQASQSPKEVSISGEAKLESPPSHFTPSLVKMSLLWAASISGSAWLRDGEDAWWRSIRAPANLYHLGSGSIRLLLDACKYSVT